MIDHGSDTVKINNILIETEIAQISIMTKINQALKSSILKEKEIYTVDTRKKATVIISNIVKIAYIHG